MGSKVSRLVAYRVKRSIGLRIQSPPHATISSFSRFIGLCDPGGMTEGLDLHLGVNRAAGFVGRGATGTRVADLPGSGPAARALRPRLTRRGSSAAKRRL